MPFVDGGGVEQLALAPGKLARQRALSEAHALKARAVLLELNLQVRAVFSDGSGRIDQRAREEHRRGIAPAGGLEPLHQPHSALVDAVERHGEVVFQLGNVVVRLRVFGEVFVQTGDERLQIFARHGQPRRLTVPAEAGHQIGAGGERLEHIHSRYAAARADAHAVVFGQQNHGIVVFRHQPGCGQPDDARIPAAAAQHDDLMIEQAVVRHHRFALGHDALFLIAAAGVFRFQLVGQRGGFQLVRCGEQREGALGVAQPSAGVDARRDLKADAARAQVAAGERGALDHHAQPQPRFPVDALKPQRHDDAVFVGQRDQIGHGGQRGQIDVGKRFLQSAQRRDQLERHARAAQIGEGIVVQQGIDDGAVRQNIARPVMVGDDHVQSQRLCRFDLVRAADAAVDRHQQRSRLRDFLDRRVVEPVALGVAVGDIVYAVQTQRAKIQRQY